MSLPGSGLLSRESSRTGRPRLCTASVTCRLTATNSPCLPGGSLVDPTCRLHHRQVADGEWISLRGLPVTRPARIAADLLADREDPEAVAQIVADAIRGQAEGEGGDEPMDAGTTPAPDGV